MISIWLFFSALTTRGATTAEKLNFGTDLAWHACCLLALMSVFWHQNAWFSIWVFENFPGVILPDPTAGGGDSLGPSRTHTQPGLWPDAGRKRHGVGTQTLVPLNFSAVVAPPGCTYGKWVRCFGQTLATLLASWVMTTALLRDKFLWTDALTARTMQFGRQISLDNVRITHLVPEKGATLLLPLT